MSAKKQQSPKASRDAEHPEGKTKTRVKERIETSMCRNVGNNMYAAKRVEIVREVWDREIRGSNPLDPDIPAFVA